jgi:hypothetical protein
MQSLKLMESIDEVDKTSSRNEGSSEDGAILLSSKKQELLESLMRSFYDWLHTANSAGQKATSPTLKRKRDNEDLSPGDKQDDNGIRKRSPNSNNPQTFACPFFKYNPDWFCSCRDAEFMSASHVKFVPILHKRLL